MSRPELGPWLTPGLVPRLIALHADERLLSYGTIAEMLSAEFGLELPRNAIVGKIFRMKLPPRPARIYKKKERPKPRQIISAPLAPIEPLPELEPDPGVGRYNFYQLKNGRCKYPFGSWPNTTFCGEPQREEGGPYCEAHHEISRIPARKTWA